MDTFDMTIEFRNELAQRELERQARSNIWEHRVGQASFAILVLALILRWAGVL
jgi:hypothetical protein